MLTFVFILIIIVCVHCYILAPVTRNQYNGNNYCLTNYGTTLACVRNLQETNQVEALCEQTTHSTCWIGRYCGNTNNCDTPDDSDWEWYGNCNVGGYLKWALYTISSENGVVIDTFYHAWIDANPNNVYPFICNSPTNNPTNIPTKYPTNIPSIIPTLNPTKNTNIPTINPTNNPTFTDHPTISTNIPSIITQIPSVLTNNPTIITVTPTLISNIPTILTLNPTKITIQPTTINPTNIPSIQPSITPTVIIQTTKNISTELNNNNLFSTGIIVLIIIISLTSIIILFLLLLYYRYSMKRKQKNDDKKLNNSYIPTANHVTSISHSLGSSIDVVPTNINYGTNISNLETSDDNIIAIHLQHNQLDVANVTKGGDLQITKGNIDKNIKFGDCEGCKKLYDAQKNKNTDGKMDNIELEYIKTLK